MSEGQGEVLGEVLHFYYGGSRTTSGTVIVWSNKSISLLLTLARACAAKGYCSRSVGLFPRFLSNRGCCRYQTWMCGYVQRALSTARVWSGVVQEQHVYGGGLKLYTVIILGVH